MGARWPRRQSQQIHFAFETARYDTVAEGITHSAPLLKELELWPAMSGHSTENADLLPFVTTHCAINSDQISLPDTEPCGDVDEVESFYYTHGQHIVTVRMLDGEYEVNLTEILRATRLPRAQRTTLLNKRIDLGLLFSQSPILAKMVKWGQSELLAPGVVQSRRAETFTASATTHLHSWCTVAGFT